MFKRTLQRAQIYWQVWLTIAKYALAETLVARWSSMLFFIGKALRFGITLYFLILLKQNISGIAGYTPDQILIFFLSYQLVDTISQVLFRGVYMFSNKVKSGELDFYLAKPLNPLFRILTGEPDIIDAIFLIPTSIISIWVATQLHIHTTLASFSLYAFLLINSLLIAAGFHIFVLCLGILTTEVDNAIMLYRDTTSLSRFPLDIYKEPLRTALFFVIPIGLMNTIPAQILLTLKPTTTVLITLGIGGGFFLLSLLAWHISLKKYTSAGG